MEIIYNVVPDNWGHEPVAARRVAPPLPEELVQATDQHGDPVYLDDGAPALVPGPNWQQKIEEVEYTAVVLLEESSRTLFKFVMDDDALANFLATYISLLNTDGRKLIRDRLEETSGLVIPTLDTTGLKLLPGGRDS